MRAQARTDELLGYSAWRRYRHPSGCRGGTGAHASSEAPGNDGGIEDQLPAARDGPQSQGAIAFRTHRKDTLRGARGRVRRSKESRGGGAGDVHDFAAAAEKVAGEASKSG